MSADTDPVASFQAAMAALGLAPKQPIQADGKLHRFDVDGDRRGSKNGWYVLHLDGRAAGAFGSWKLGIKENWKSNGTPFDDFTLAKLNRQIEAERRHREREEAKRYEEVAEDAATLWAGYSPAPADHPYLERKQVQPHGARIDGQGRLVLDASDVDGKIWSLQTIDANGRKLFMYDGRKRGCMFTIGEPGDQIVIAEGFATGASIHEATGLRVAVAFDAGNLEPVALAIKKRLPGVQIVIAADDDRKTREPIENPGVHYARKAAAAVGGHVAVPVFQEPDGKDFNDLAVAEGSEAVARIILDAFPEVGPELDAEQPEDEWEVRLAEGIARMNKRHFVAMLKGSTVVASDYLNHGQLVLHRAEDIRLRYAHERYVVGISQKGNEIWKGLGEAWINHARRRTYDRIELIPKGPCPDDVYNLWRGFGIESKPGRWDKIGWFLLHVICSGNRLHYQWLLNWIAYCVQNPDKQAEVAVVLQGLKGIGKGTLGRIMLRLFGVHSKQISQGKHLTGHFNAHLLNVLFLFVDEAFWAGDKQGEGVLKALVTEPTLMIEPKGIDPFEMPNRLKILIASNGDWVVPASADERRYFVLKVSECRMGSAAYFNELNAAIDGHELPAMLHDLLNLDLSGWDHRNPPHTAALNEQKLISADSFTKYWYDCLATGRIIGMGDTCWPETIDPEELRAAYVDHAHQHGDRHPLTIEWLGRKLRKLSPKDFKASRPRVAGSDVGRSTVYLLQSLELHRIAFLEAMKIDPAGHVWPEDED